MDGIKVLDCTIRDGGHLNAWQFGSDFVESYLQAILAQEVDTVEIGYRSTPGCMPGSGTWRYTPDETIIAALESVRPRSGKLPKIAVMADAGKITPEDFAEKKDSPVDLVRVAFYKRDKEEGISFAEKMKDKGYLVGINFMSIGEYSPQDLEEEAKKISRTGIDFVYFADSYGSLGQKETREITTILMNCGKPIGFHSHNNLQNATSNAWAAIAAGATYIDGTIYGMGRGAGNLPTELLLYELERRGQKKLFLEKLLPFVGLQQKLKAEFSGEINWGYSIDHFMSGILNIHPNYTRYLREKYPSLSLVDRYKILQAIPSGSQYSEKTLQQASNSILEPIHTT